MALEGLNSASERTISEEHRRDFSNMPADKRDTLHKKQSSADLQSRLKSRKLLGVGVTDDGLDIHRSKVSQILGQSEILLNPNRTATRGLLQWNFWLSTILLIWAFSSLLLPKGYSWIMFGEAHSVNIFYSVSLLCYSLPMMAMSRTIVDNNTQYWSLLSSEILLVTHVAGAIYGGAFYATVLFLAILTIANTFILFDTVPDDNRIISMLRRMSQSREHNSNAYPYTDKKTE